MYDRQTAIFPVERIKIIKLCGNLHFFYLKKRKRGAKEAQAAQAKKRCCKDMPRNVEQIFNFLHSFH
jgi:hypothetical protein